MALAQVPHDHDHDQPQEGQSTELSLAPPLTGEVHQDSLFDLPDAVVSTTDTVAETPAPTDTSELVAPMEPGTVLISDGTPTTERKTTVNKRYVEPSGSSNEATTPKKRSSRLRGIMGAAGIVAGLGLGGGLLAIHNSSDSTPAKVATEQPAQQPDQSGDKPVESPSTTAQVVTASTEAPQVVDPTRAPADPTNPHPEVSPTTTPETVSSLDHFDPTVILPGEPTLKATRPNQEVITVPALRSFNQDPNAVASSFWALVDGYETTRDPALLDAIAPAGSQPRQALEEVFGHIETNMKGNLGVSSLPKDYQIVTFSDPDKPATFSKQVSGGNTVVISQTSGRTLVNPYTAYDRPIKFQAPETQQTTYSYGYEMTDFKLELTTMPDGSTKVVNLGLSLNR